MHWRYKALLQGAFSSLPGGEGLNYLCQRWVTKSLPTRSAKFSEIVAHAEEHIQCPGGAGTLLVFLSGLAVAFWKDKGLFLQRLSQARGRRSRNNPTRLPNP